MKKLALIVLAVMLVFSLAACADTQEPQEPTDAELDQVTVVLDWVPNVNHTGLYVAEANGYFAEQGLDVEIIQPGDILPSSWWQQDKLEFGVSYQEEVTFAREADIPVISIAAVIQHNTFLLCAPKENNIRTIAGFCWQDLWRLGRRG